MVLGEVRIVEDNWEKKVHVFTHVDYLNVHSVAFFRYYKAIGTSLSHTPGKNNATTFITGAFSVANLACSKIESDKESSSKCYSFFLSDFSWNAWLIWKNYKQLFSAGRERSGLQRQISKFREPIQLRRISFLQPTFSLLKFITKRTC